MVVLIGAVVRIGMLLTRWSSPLPFSDAVYFSGQARELAHGVWFVDPFTGRPDSSHPPLTTMVLALVSRLEPVVSMQRLVTALIGISTVAVIGLLARRVAGDRVGIVAALIAAVYPNIWLPDGLVMAESIATFLVCVTMYTAMCWWSRPSIWTSIRLGAVLALSALARSELALLGIVIVVGLLISERGSGRPVPYSRIGLVALTSGALVLPWVAFNLIRFERPVLFTTNEGALLLGANCEGTYYPPDVGGWSFLCVIAEEARLAEFSSMDASERSHHYRERALEYISNQQTRLPTVITFRALRVLSAAKLDQVIAQDVGEDRERWAVVLGIPMFWALSLLAFGGGRKLRSTDLSILIAPIVVAGLVAVVFYGTHRLRAPAEPSIVILASVAVVHFWERRTRHPLLVEDDVGSQVSR